MKLNYKRTVLIGMAFLSISAFWQMYDNVIPLILKNTFGMGETLTGTIMAAQVITPILSGALLEHISYRTLFPYSVFFSLLAFCTMSMVKHGDSKPEQKKSMLENFDVDD